MWALRYAGGHIVLLCATPKPRRPEGQLLPTVLVTMQHVNWNFAPCASSLHADHAKSCLLFRKLPCGLSAHSRRLTTLDACPGWTSHDAPTWCHIDCRCRSFGCSSTLRLLFKENGSNPVCCHRGRSCNASIYARNPKCLDGACFGRNDDRRFTSSFCSSKATSRGKTNDRQSPWCSTSRNYFTGSNPQFCDSSRFRHYILDRGFRQRCCWDRYEVSRCR